MDQEGKTRAGAYLAAQAARRGWSPAQLAEAAGLDAQTVRTFMEGETWPWAIKRQAMERAVDLEPGTLTLAAKGQLSQVDVDPVERAIGDSPLSRANKAKLLGTYYDMLDNQRGEATG